MKSKFLGLMAGAMLSAAIVAPAQAVVWKGPNWIFDAVSGSSGAVNGVTGSYEVTMGATAPTGYTVTGLRIVPGTTNTAMKWVQFSFVDRQNSNGTWPYAEIFYNGTGGINNRRGSFGASYVVDSGGWHLDSGYPSSMSPYGRTNTAATSSDPYIGFYAETKYSPAGTARTPSFAVSSGSNVATTNSTTGGIGTKLTRVDGSTVTVKIGILPNGAIEYTMFRKGGAAPAVTDQWVSSFFPNSGLNTQTIFSQIELRLGNTEALATYEYLDYKSSIDLNGAVYANYFQGQAIPEPASLGLLAAGGVLMLARRRKMA